MRKEQGFTLIELLIVVAIIAIIAAIAIPNLLTARMAANETGAIASLRTIGSAEIAYSAVNNGQYGNLGDLVAAGNLDARFTTGAGFNGYSYNVGAAAASPAFNAAVPGFLATPIAVGNTGRYNYGMGSDLSILYLAGAPAPMCGAAACAPGDAIGQN
jgi:prepilin-type N-terminal cleavage/methylation domain-containing protein